MNVEDLTCTLSNNRNENPNRLNRIKGAIIGGAIGDALGYPIEFMKEDEIIAKYGLSGMSEFDLDSETGKAMISDDTQMSLFTANGLLVAATNGEKNIAACVARSYEDWLATQMRAYEDMHEPERRDPNSEFYHMDNSWLLDVPEIYSSRAPGSTCVYSMIERVKDGPLESYLKKPINTSKGCGGIMRVASVGIYTSQKDVQTIDLEAAEISAITHSHPLGFMPAAMLADILYRIVNYNCGVPLLSIVKESKDTINKLFENLDYLSELNAVVDKAVELSKNDACDIDNIHQIGEGWVAEETLGIALYCSLKYEKDFSKGVIAAVNHKGDSDSTGAVTGNILGAINGFDAIEDKWKNNLELFAVLSEISQDLFALDTGEINNRAWQNKYVNMIWK